MPRRIRIPRLTDIRHHRRQHPLPQQPRLLNRIDVQPPTHMPRDVAMKGPRAGVVGVVLQNDVGGIVRGAALQHLRVAALRVLRVRDVAVPFAEALG